jgi:hypothetical protein
MSTNISIHPPHFRAIDLPPRRRNLFAFSQRDEFEGLVRAGLRMFQRRAPAPSERKLMWLDFNLREICCTRNTSVVKV